MKKLALAALLVAITVIPAHAQVSVNIGIQLPGPPTFVVVPGSPVYYAPQAPANVFLYGHQYWAFANGGWYVGATWNGPWGAVQPTYVPAPILQVPVAYYHAPPPHWKGWRRDAAPRWEEHYGREWREAEHERSWREREEKWSHGRGHGGCPPGLAKQGRC